MPFLTIDTVLPDVQLGVWQITEDELFFLERVKLYENEWKRLARIAHPMKRLEWLSSRLCLKELLQISDFSHTESLNAITGKPYLSNDPHHISYTHSNHYSAAIASKGCEVGIDIEFLGRKRNPKTRFLWMNDQELAYYEQAPDSPFFILAWSAKETVYKLFGSGVAFKHHIAIQVDDLTITDNGILHVFVNKEGFQKKYEIAYAIYPDFLLTYTGDCVLEQQRVAEATH
ncbi:MAG: 4'-phosphopantetheinyl transferase superfamily protein [Bacteroidia bacterium]|nr:4'-phosphopantetheinyl transferase superfamily protein [Bacteroidia bacterium]